MGIEDVIYTEMATAKIDAKCLVSVPKKFRELIELRNEQCCDLHLIISKIKTNQRSKQGIPILLAYGIKDMVDKNGLMKKREPNDYTRINYFSGKKVSVNNIGRICIGTDLRNYLQLKKSNDIVLYIGNCDNIVLVSREIWFRYAKNNQYILK